MTPNKETTMTTTTITVYFDTSDPAFPGWAWRTDAESGPLFGFDDIDPGDLTPADAHVLAEMATGEAGLTGTVTGTVTGYDESRPFEIEVEVIETPA